MNPEELDQQLERLHQSAKSASSEGLTEEALRLCDEALALLETYGEDTERFTYSEFVMLTGDVYWGAGDWEMAYESYERVALNDPDRPDARVAMGIALFHLCRFQAAQTTLEMCSVSEPDDPEVWYYLGLLALRNDKRDLAMVHFETASELQEDRFSMPVEVTEDEVLDLTERLLEEIPEPIKDALQNVPIVLEKRPSEAFLFTCDPPMDPTVLGLFEGVPMVEADSSAVVTSPNRIVLFLENIWIVAGDPDKLEEELWITLKHEIGHYFGLSEEDLAERGLD